MFETLTFPSPKPEAENLAAINDDTTIDDDGDGLFALGWRRNPKRRVIHTNTKKNAAACYNAQTHASHTTKRDFEIPKDNFLSTFARPILTTAS